MIDQKLLQIILGDIAANKEYGIVMKKWRELFNITQSRIAKKLKIKQSVISDYENNRRKSPGIGFLRRYTSSLINIASNEKRQNYEDVKKSMGLVKEKKILLKGDFKKNLTNKELVKLFKATQIIAPKSQSDFKKYVFFYDNISKILTRQPSLKLIKGLKSINKTVYIFSNVKTGKVPLIMLKILSKLNNLELPKLIIFQCDKFKLSSITRRIAKNNNISILITKLSKEKIKQLLDKNQINTVYI